MGNCMSLGQTSLVQNTVKASQIPNRQQENKSNQGHIHGDQKPDTTQSLSIPERGNITNLPGFKVSPPSQSSKQQQEPSYLQIPFPRFLPGKNYEKPRPFNQPQPRPVLHYQKIIKLVIQISQKSEIVGNRNSYNYSNQSSSSNSNSNSYNNTIFNQFQTVQGQSVNSQNYQYIIYSKESHNAQNNAQSNIAYTNQPNKLPVPLKSRIQNLRIEDFQLQSCGFIEQMIMNKGRFTSLKKLYLESCHIDDEILKKICEAFPKLEKINVAFNCLTVNAFKEIPENIKSIVVGWKNKQKEQIHEILTHLDRMEHIHYKSSITPEIFTILMTSTPKMTKLTLSDKNTFSILTKLNIQQLQNHSLLEYIQMKYYQSELQTISMMKKEFINRVLETHRILEEGEQCVGSSKQDITQKSSYQQFHGY